MGVASQHDGAGCKRAIAASGAEGQDQLADRARVAVQPMPPCLPANSSSECPIAELVELARIGLRGEVEAAEPLKVLAGRSR